MPTFHRRNGSVKYVPPKRLLEGLRPAVAIPATLFAGALVVVIAFALHKTPKEQKWVNLREEISWKPALSDQGEPLSADRRFLFERAVDRALTPRATLWDVAPMAEGKATTPAAGRLVWSDGDQMLVEHSIGQGDERRFEQSRITGVMRPNAEFGMIVQRGDLLGEGSALGLDVAEGILALPQATESAAPRIRDTGEEFQAEPTFHLGR